MLFALPSSSLVSYSYAMKHVVALGLAIGISASSVFAQLQQGTIIGSLTGPSGVSISEARITLFDQLGNAVMTVTAVDGQFRLTNVAIGSYSLKAEAAPFQAVVNALTVADALPITLELKLSAALAEQVNVTAETNQPVTTTTRTTLAGDAVRRAPIRISSRGLQDAIATTPGWATEDNGLLHARGVDDGFLYVVDGVPMYERMDSVHGVAPHLEMVESVNVLVGHVPPEFGFKSGGVIEVRTSSGKSDSWQGNVQASTGSDATRQGSSVFGGPIGRATALTLGFSGQRSDRFLDPVHPDNLHNSGNAANVTADFNWLVSSSSTLSIVGGASRSGFDVPHNEEQEEAHQDQRQTNLQTWQTASWQHAWSANTISQVAGYHRSGSALLLGTERDTPLFIDADRSLRRTGVLGSVTHQRGRQVVKAGVEAARLSLHENFSFFVTDEHEAEEADLSEGVLEHDDDDPFVFAGRANPTLLALYVQDSIQFGRGLTIDVGVRFDRARMLVESSQWSPRLGMAYHVPDSGTTFRASIDRFFQPPQAEYLLLGSSEQARELSPFVRETGGGEDLEPERQWAGEVGISQTLPRASRIDVSYWRRRIESVSDPNVLFGTTLFVPNSIARGEADGVDVRLDLPRRGGASGYVSYTNSRVVNFGPVTGGLFLEDEVIEIADGTRFIPDHDQRHVAAFGASYDHPRGGFWASFGGRYESGTPLEVEEEELDALMERPGSELVNVETGRVRPRQIFDVMAGLRVLRAGGHELSLRGAILNVAGERFAYNFGNPFSGTHFGAGRTFQIGLQVNLGRNAQPVSRP
jgi:outer membrane receptor for ferrienterochelin and colicin